LEKHIENYQIQPVDPNKYKSLIPTDMCVAGEDHDIDIPERMQVIISKCLLITKYEYKNFNKNILI